MAGVGPSASSAPQADTVCAELRDTLVTLEDSLKSAMRIQGHLGTLEPAGIDEGKTKRPEAPSVDLMLRDVCQKAHELNRRLDAICIRIGE